MTDIEALKFTQSELKRMRNKNKPPTYIVRNASQFDSDVPTSSKEGAINLIKSRLLSGKKRVCHLAKYNPKRIYEDDPYVNIERWELINGIPKKVGIR